MKKTCLIFLIVIGFVESSNATWSIIIIDPRTKQIGMAAASCTENVYGIGSIVPGKGAIIVQAASNYNAQDVGRKKMILGYWPEDIITIIRQARFDPEHQQYAIVTLYNMSASAYTGDSTSPFNGSVTGEGISVQGNILASDTLLKAVYAAALKGQRDSLDVEEILMMALEAGAKAGGDRRCGTVQTATSAFIEIAKPEDKPGSPSLQLIVKGIQKGGENAVAVLRKKYNEWKVKNKPLE